MNRHDSIGTDTVDPPGSRVSSALDGQPSSLPGRYYTAAEVLEKEMECLFSRTWLYVGHASQIPQPGDFFTATLLDENVLVVRSQAGSVNAYYDVCRHRGSRICGTEA